MLDITHAQGAYTGKRYMASLQDSREVWLNGEHVDVTTHQTFAGMQYEMPDSMIFSIPQGTAIRGLLSRLRLDTR